MFYINDSYEDHFSNQPLKPQIPNEALYPLLTPLQLNCGRQRNAFNLVNLLSSASEPLV